MNRYNLFFILFSLIHSFCYSQKSYDAKITKYLSTYNINDENAALILCINSNDCINCMVPLSQLFSDITQNNITNVTFLIDGIDESEKEKYFQTVLHQDPVGKKIIVDKNFYNAINPSLNSKLVVFQKGKIEYFEDVKNMPDDNRIELLFYNSSMFLSVSDSIIIDSKYLSGVYAYDFIDSETIITLNPKYQEISCIDINKNSITKTITNKSLNLNVDSLLTNALFSSDSALLKYNLWHRNQTVNFFTKNPLFPEVELMNLVIQDSLLLVAVGIALIQPSFNNGDTSLMITKIPYIFHLSKDLKIKNIFSFEQESYIPKNYSTTVNSPFYYNEKENKIFIRALFFSETGKFKSSKSTMQCVVKNNKIQFDKLLDFDLPEFFIQKRYFNNNTNCSFVNINHNTYLYFLFVPSIFDITKNKTYSIANTRYKKTSFNTSSPSKTQVHFILQTIFPLQTQNGLGVCYISEDKKATVVFYNEDWSEMSRKLLSNTQFFSVKAKYDYLYAFNRSLNAEKILIYKYKI